MGIKANLSVMEVNSIHGEFLCILQEIHLGLCRSHPPVCRIRVLSVTDLNYQPIISHSGSQIIMVISSISPTLCSSLHP